MKCICPECKNNIDLSNYSSLSPGYVIECNVCGINLEVIEIANEKVVTEIVDEGK